MGPFHKTGLAQLDKKNKNSNLKKIAYFFKIINIKVMKTIKKIK